MGFFQFIQHIPVVLNQFISVITAVIGFIAGFLSKGAQTMLTEWILSSRIHLGKITKSSKTDAEDYPFWYIPVTVRAKRICKLVLSDIKDVRVDITFISDLDISETYQSTWWQPGRGVPMIDLRIGGEYRFTVATQFPSYSSHIIATEVGDELDGDYDLTIKLSSDGYILGQWRCTKAIVQSSVQEVEPIRSKA
jgi:hypothetical protein